MFQIDCKVTETNDLKQKIQTFVQKNYGNDVWAKLVGFFTGMSEMRNTVAQMQEPAASKQFGMIPTLQTYLQFVDACEKRVPIGKTASTANLEFVWYSSEKNKQRFVKKQSFTFEKGCIIFNIGALYNNQGIEHFYNTKDHKQASQCFLQAASYFQELQLNYSSHFIIEILNTYLQIAQAQALVMVYDKADKQTMLPLNLAKITNKIRNFYNSACNVPKKLRDEAFPQNKIQFLWFQAALYSCLTYNHMQLHYRDQVNKTAKGHGMRVLFLRKAQELVQCLENQKSFNTIPAEYKTSFKPIFIQIAADLAQAEHDNKSVYMEPVPAQLEQVQDMNALKIPEFSITSHPEALALDYMIPKEVQPLWGEYKLKVQEIVTQCTERINKAEQQSSQLVNQCQVHQLIGGQSGIIPDYIWNQVAEAQAKGGIQSLEQQNKSLSYLSQNSSQVVQTLENDLMKEQNEDDQLRQQYQQRWTRHPSKSITPQLWADLQKFKQAISQATQSDQFVLQKFESSKPQMEILSQSKEQLNQQVAPQQEQQQTPEQGQLNETLSKIQENGKARQTALNDLLNQSSNDHISASLLRVFRKEVSKEQCFQEELSKYAPFQEVIDKTLAEQASLIQNLQTLCASIRSTKGSGGQQQNQLIQQLETAVRLFNETNRNFNQGVHFYTNFAQSLTNLQQKISDFIYSRNMEKNDIISRMR